jgi:hypothetical protein
VYFFVYFFVFLRILIVRRGKICGVRVYNTCNILSITALKEVAPVVVVLLVVIASSSDATAVVGIAAVPLAS